MELLRFYLRRDLHRYLQALPHTGQPMVTFHCCAGRNIRHRPVAVADEL